MNKRNAEIMQRLEQAYPDAKPGLDYHSAFELLIATILSAQCTDVRVNICTAALFRDCPTATDIVALGEKRLIEYIKSCGLYQTKAKNIIATCNILVNEYGGEVPNDREKLEALPGVGRKTANVVLSNAFGVDAIAVDTHVFRVSNRIGLADAKNVLDTEKQLMQNIDKRLWSRAHHWLIWHGRQVCRAKNPKCTECVLNGLCKDYTIREPNEPAQTD